jgi:hypothetical protein
MSNYSIYNPGSGYVSGDHIDVNGGNEEGFFIIDVVAAYDETWSFGTDGTTTFPNNTLKTYTNSNLTVQTQVVYNITTITNGGTGYGSQSGTSTSGGSGTGMTVNVNQSGTVVDLVIVNNPGTGYQNGDTITILSGSGTATFTIDNYSSTGSNGANNWNFGSDGTLTLPGDIYGPATHYSFPPHQVNGHALGITPASDAPTKKFNFRIDQYGEPFTRAYLEMPPAEVNKQVAISFPHTNGTIGYIFTQGANTNDDGMNNAFNLLYNSGDIKLTAEGIDGLKTWKFGNDGTLTIPGDIHSPAGSGPVTITSNDNSNDYTWTFTSTGGITIPSVQYTDFVNINATSSNIHTIGQNAYIDFTNFSGEILVNDLNDGFMYKILVGSGKISIMGSTNEAWLGPSPSTSVTVTGYVTVEYIVSGSGSYRFTNLATSRDFNFFAIKTRNGL